MMTRVWLVTSLILAICLVPVTPASAGLITNDPVSPVFSFTDPGAYFAYFDMGNGITFEFILNFEDTTGLADNSLTVTAELFDPSSLPCAVCLRLPGDVFPSNRFPVLIDVSVANSFSFRGGWAMEIITESLDFTQNSPLRLYRAASSLTSFQDITETIGFGSFRVRGQGGGFSQFLIVNDLRPVNGPIQEKFTRTQAAITANSGDIDSNVKVQLETFLGTALTKWQAKIYGESLGAIDDAIDLIRSEAGDKIANEWDPPEFTISVSGVLRALFETLRFSIAIDAIPDGLTGDSLRLELNPGPGLKLDVILRFEGSFDIDLSAFASGNGVTATVIDPIDYVDRLPSGVQVPSEFPVLVNISPGVEESFNDSFTIEFRTENLQFIGGTNLRLFKAPDGGAFEDITSTMGIGSYRVLGIGGSFSEFLIVEDNRPVADVIQDKIADLDTFINENSADIPTEVIDAWDDFLVQVDLEDFEAAFDSLEIFFDILEDNIDLIPSIWLPEEKGVVNVGGTLESLASSLQLTLTLNNNPLDADPADADRDGDVDVDDIFEVINRVFGGTAFL